MGAQLVLRLFRFMARPRHRLFAIHHLPFTIHS